MITINREDVRAMRGTIWWVVSVSANNVLWRQLPPGDGLCRR